MCYNWPYKNYKEEKLEARYQLKPISLNWARERLLPYVTIEEKGADQQTYIDDLCLAYHGFKERIKQFLGQGNILEEDIKESKEEPLTQ